MYQATKKSQTQVVVPPPPRPTPTPATHTQYSHRKLLGSGVVLELLSNQL